MRSRSDAWLAGIIALVSACTGTPSATYPPLPTFPVPAEVLAPGNAGPASIMVTCDGQPFPIEALYAPSGAEFASGPEFDALRENVERFFVSSGFPRSEPWPWRVVRRDDASVQFVARTDDLGPPGWVVANVSRDQTGWHPGSIGQCDPKVLLSQEFGPASWALDPDFPAPAAATTELRLLVWERACSGGAPATHRISPPAVLYGSDSITITLGVRPIEVPPGYAIPCPGPPGTPAILQLTEPIGERDLLDGGSVPPAPPKNPFGP